MARKKENKRTDGYYEYKCIIDRKFDGSPIYKSFYSRKSKADARLKAEEYKIELLNQKNQAEFMTLHRWLDIFMESVKPKVKATTFMNKYHVVINVHLKNYFGDVPLNAIKKTDIEQYMKDKSEELCVGSMRYHISCLKRAYAEAIDNGYVDYNPCTNIKVIGKKSPKEKRIYSAEQTELVLKFAETHKFGIPIHLMLMYGLSRSEALGITYNDIDFENKTISINKAVTPGNSMTHGSVEAETKNKYRNRMIAVKEETLALIQSSCSSGHVCDNGKEKTPCVRTFTVRYQRFMKDMVKHYAEQGIDIPALNPHELRHTRASIWVNEGKNLFAIAQQLGWADLSMLRRVYGHGDIQQLRKELGL